MLLILTLLALAVTAAPAAAQCSVTGHISATESDSEFGAWQYTMDVTWDTGAVYALSHLDLLVDLPGGTCSCMDVMDAISFAEFAGSSNGEPDGCSVDYEGFIECNGDPSIPGIDGILFKWEPLETDGSCEPGPVGSGTFVFYSDLAPVAVDTDLQLMVIKDGGEICEGGISGVFPGLLCDPVPASSSTWSAVKEMYDR